MNTIIKNCPKCNKEFETSNSKKAKKFCSRSCANSRGPRSAEIKQKISASLTGRKCETPKGKFRVPRIDKPCLQCNTIFTSIEKENKKYCSNDCWKKQSGGYREGSGRAKTGYYKGIYCGSTYELCWVIYSLDHNVSFTRFGGFLEKDGIKYYPDFLLEDGKTIIELKGYEQQGSVDKKTAVAESFGYTVIVLRKEQLEKEFKYVSDNYSSHYKTLYDEYKPKYNYVCDHCSAAFSRDCKLKTAFVFCSRVCSGKYRSLRPKTDETKQKISMSLTGKKRQPFERKTKQIWITDGNISTRINASANIPEGFRRGRIKN